MPLAHDENRLGELSPTANQLLALQEEIFAYWMKQVRQQLPHAAELSEPVLTDTLPTIFEEIAYALSPAYLGPCAVTPTNTVPQEHGSERARLTNYNIDDIINEYLLLKTAVVEVMNLHQVSLSNTQLLRISSVIDASIKEAACGSVFAQTVFRERFAAALMHDLRNPLSTAMITAELIEQTNGIPLHQLTHRLKLALLRMEEMINQILDTIVFHSGQRLHLRCRELDIAELVQEVVSHADVGKIDFKRNGPSIKGWWDRNSLKRALENLIDNAMKYSVPSCDPICLNWRASHSRLILSINNHGPTIPSAELESIFKVYERAMMAKNCEKQGWGIGLSFVRSVAESHGGSITAESSPESGTTFTLDIPLDARPFQSAASVEG